MDWNSSPNTASPPPSSWKTGGTAMLVSTVCCLWVYEAGEAAGASFAIEVRNLARRRSSAWWHVVNITPISLANLALRLAGTTIPCFLKQTEEHDMPSYHL